MSPVQDKSPTAPTSGNPGEDKSLVPNSMTVVQTHGADNNHVPNDSPHLQVETSEQAAEENKERCHIVFVGNPGVGKSTILNSLSGSTEPIFKSGVSASTGLTTILQTYETENVVLCDTPGLLDVKTKNKAAEEINKLFRSGSVKYMKLVFVVTLESGRVRNDDVVMMDLVLSSLQDFDLTNKFGVIINKVKERTKEKLTEADLLAIYESFTTKFQTCHIKMNDFDKELDEADNAVSKPTEVVSKVLADVSTLELKSERVADIDVDEVEALREKHEQELQSINDMFKLAVAANEEERKRHEKVMGEGRMKREKLEKDAEEKKKYDLCPWLSSFFQRLEFCYRAVPYIGAAAVAVAEVSIVAAFGVAAIGIAVVGTVAFS